MVASGAAGTAGVVGDPDSAERADAPGAAGVDDASVARAGGALLTSGASMGRDTHAPRAMVRIKSKSSTYGFFAVILFPPLENRLALCRDRL